METSYDRAPDATTRPEVSALANTVLSVLNELPAESRQTIRTSIVRKLIGHTLRGVGFDPITLLNELQDGRVATDQIVDIYIPQAARELGDMWQDDAIGFAAVTIATARLQGLLTLLSPSWTATRQRGANTLMVMQPQDSHTLGPHVATAQLRRQGASVRLLFGPDKDDLLQVLRDERFDLVMFTCSRIESLANVAQMVKRVRSGAGEPPPIALGGLVLELADRLKERTGVDLVTSDVKVAFKLCGNNRMKTKSVAR